MVTAPPSLLWKGSGMSTLRLLGHSSTAPMITASPITDSAVTTIRAANWLSGAGRWWECRCVCATPECYWR